MCFYLVFCLFGESRERGTLVRCVLVLPRNRKSWVTSAGVRFPQVGRSVLSFVSWLSCGPAGHRDVRLCCFVVRCHGLSCYKVNWKSHCG